MYPQNNWMSPSRVSVNGFVVGGVSTLAVAGAANARAVRKEEKGKDEAIRDTLITSLEGGVALGTGLSAAEKFFRGNYGGALFSAALGAAAVYAIHQLNQNMSQKEKGDA